MSRYRAFIILILDVLTIFLCNFLTMLPYLLGQDIRLLNLVLHIGLLTVCVLLFQVCLKTYDTLWRYAESREYLALLEGMGLGFALYSVVNLLLGTSRIWISSALTGTALALLVMLGYRFVYRSYRRRVTGVGCGPRAYAAIIGAGSAGAALVSEMDDRIYGRYRPYCVIDDAAEKQQKRIHGVPVLGPIDEMEEILADTPVTDIILAIQNLTPERRQEILNLCARTQRRVHVLGSPVTRLHARQGDYIAAVREVEIEDLLGRALPITPKVMDFAKLAAADSMLNTPNCFGIYVAGLTFKWIKAQGGVAALEARNIEKAKLLYDYLDESKLFTGTAQKRDRSRMNVTFVTGDAALDAKFVKEAAAQGLVNLKGHRIVGGMRASIYNAMPVEGVQKLVDFMKQFETEN